MAATDTAMQSILTPIGRLAFIQTLFNPQPPAAGKEPRFSVTILFDPETQKSPEYLAMRRAFGQAATDKWGNRLPPDLQKPLQDAGAKSWDGFEAGWTFLRAWSKFPPGIVGPDRRDIISDRDVHAGMWGRLDIKPYAYDNQTKGVGAALNHVQFAIMSGPRVTRLDGKGDPAKRFGDLPAEVLAENAAGGGAGAGGAGGSAAVDYDDIPF